MKSKLVTASLVLGVALLLGLQVGSEQASIIEALRDPSSLDYALIFKIRGPKTLLAAICGAALSGVGVALQALFKNPLAEPFVLGVSGGSALGATLAIFFGVTSLGLMGVALLPLCALLTALLSMLAVFSFARGGSGRSDRLLLAGVAINAMAAGLVTFIKLLATRETAQNLLLWLTGFLEVPSLATLLSVAAYAGFGVTILLFDAARLNVLSLGEREASALGIQVRNLETRTIVACSVVTAGVVSRTGLIGFVGLIVPHLVRRWVGADIRKVLPMSLLVGGGILVLCDVVTRVAFRWVHTEPPVGAVTAVIGGPLFLWMVIRKPVAA